jgi:hypothetical protein
MEPGMRADGRSGVVAGFGALGAVPFAIPECPIEQTIRARDPQVRSALHDEAKRRGQRADAWLVADTDGARALAKTESALRPLVAGIVERHGDAVVVSAPRVRYVHRPQLAEPWMRIHASGPSILLPLILRDLDRRKGRTVRIDDHGGPFQLEAEAPLANLLGYAEWLDELCEGRAELSLRLVRYSAVDLDDGPEAA